MTDLLVVGAGTLGMLVARQWRTLYPGAGVTLMFRSDNSERRSELVREGFRVVSKEAGDDQVSAPLVVFSAPPTGNTEYAQDILTCVTHHWSRDAPGSVMVFTSAGSVYQAMILLWDGKIEIH